MSTTTLTVPTSTGNDGFFKMLGRCVAASFLLLVLAAALKLPPWITMAGGGLPLVYYHLGYLARRTRTGLNQTAIDSVYYFGFLVTIAALGISAVSLAASEGKEPLVNIAYQFGLGLLATGYAVLARMHLASLAAHDATSTEEVMDRYVKRSGELVTNVELAATQFTELTTTLTRRTTEVAEAAHANTERIMLEVARLFDEQLRATLASGREGLTELRALVNETSFAKEREALARSIQATLGAVTALNKALADFAARATEGARASETVACSTGTLNDTIGTFSTHLERIGGPDGQMVTATRALAAAQQVAVDSTAALTEVVRDLGTMTGTVSGMGVTFKNIRTLTLKANEQLGVLVDNAGRLDEASRHLATSAQATGALAGELERTAAALPNVGARAEALSVQLAGLSTVTATATQRLDALVEPADDVVELGDEIKTVLGEVRGALASAGNEAKALAGHATANVEALAQARQLGADVGTLQATTTSVNALLASLATTVEQLQQRLGSSTGTLDTALVRSTTALEQNVQRSGEAAQLFGERLTTVARLIIDHTRGADGHAAR